MGPKTTPRKHEAITDGPITHRVRWIAGPETPALSPIIGFGTLAFCEAFAADCRAEREDVAVELVPLCGPLCPNW